MDTIQLTVVVGVLAVAVGYASVRVSRLLRDGADPCAGCTMKKICKKK
ncbi:MAG: hypothetical protein IJ637_01665 [Prevotella sp.]|nr:hypothetical protein [Prevotella sp.]